MLGCTKTEIKSRVPGVSRSGFFVNLCSLQKSELRFSQVFDFQPLKTFDIFKGAPHAHAREQH